MEKMTKKYSNQGKKEQVALSPTTLDTRSSSASKQHIYERSVSRIVDNHPDTLNKRCEK